MKIFLHNTGGRGRDRYASSADLTWQQINKAHKDKWNFKSSMGFYVGYNATYDPKDRTFTQHRAVGEETAAQRGYNNEFSLCIIGNYTAYRGKSVDELTQHTRDDVASFLFDLINGNKRNLVMYYYPQPTFSLKQICPHRFVSNTECYGSFLSDSIFLDDLLNLYKVKIDVLKRLVGLYIKIIALFEKKQLGSVEDRECSGLIK